jgi:hypothetical protein
MSSTTNPEIPAHLIEQLRNVHPVGPGPLSYPAAARIARLQAERLAAIAHALGLRVSEVVAQATEIEIHSDPRLPVPSASQFNTSTGKWQIILDAKPPQEQQQHELLREFKRILDARDAGLLYDPSTPDGEVQQFMASSYFARVALMPELEVRQAVSHGVTTINALTDRFGAWIDAARMRVSDLDLTNLIRID